MQTIVSAQEMRWCDDTTIRKHRIPGLTLMEHAGAGVAELAQEHFGPLTGKHVFIVCGKGNNGGDGFVAARLLANAGALVTVALLVSAKKLEGDARTCYEILNNLRRVDAHCIDIKPFSRTLLQKLPKPALIIDAIFGTGFSGRVRQPFAAAIDWINKQSAPVLSVDIPSGVDGTTGAVVDKAVNARRTATFGLLKTGLLCNQGQDHVGKVTVVDIGIPHAVSHSRILKTFRVDREDVRRALPHRPSTAHKYSVGKVLVLAGSKGYTGAAYLAAMAALRAGAGAVLLGIPEAVYSILARRLTEVIVKPLPATADGSLSLESLKTVKEKVEWADVVALGPGLSTNDETQEAVKTLLEIGSVKFVVDADALRAVGKIGLKRFKRLKGRFILTPHSGELSRLIEEPAKEIESNRIEVARKSATEGELTVVLKGAPTAVGTSDGKVYVNSTGNPGMATVGSGDVLTGIIASLWAQGMAEETAAFSGVYLHGLSGDIAKEVYGERSVIAQDLIDQLPAALKRVESA